MAENKMNNTEFFPPEEGGAYYNNVTGGGESASGGSGGSGMDCMQLRSPPPGPFQYLITEQAKSLVALQELQNEVGALLEFRDLVIETFPNLRSKMSPSTPAAARRDWEPGVRVRRKIVNSGEARSKPQQSVQDSGFSTETSCGKDVHSSASASTSRARPIEDELLALLDVIQRKGHKLRDEAESLRGELDERRTDETAEESFARALSAAECDCSEARRLREERESLLSRTAQLEATALLARTAAVSPRTPLGRLDRVLETPSRPPRVPTPDSKKFAAILHESNPVELQRQLLTATVQTQVLSEKLRTAAAQRTAILDKLDRARDLNDDLKFQLEEKTIELEGARAKVRQLEGRMRTPNSEECAATSERASRDCRQSRDSMCQLEPVALPHEIVETPRRRPSRIPLHRARAGAGGPRSRSGDPPSRPASAASARSRHSHDHHAHKKPSNVPVPRDRRPPQENKKYDVQERKVDAESYHDSLNFVTTRSVSQATELVAEYLRRSERVARLVAATPPPPPRCRPAPHNLALELYHSILYEDVNSIDVKALNSIHSHADTKQSDDSLWNGKPQKYFDSMRYSEDDLDVAGDSLAQ